MSMAALGARLVPGPVGDTGIPGDTGAQGDTGAGVQGGHRHTTGGRIWYPQASEVWAVIDYTPGGSAPRPPAAYNTLAIY